MAIVYKSCSEVGEMTSTHACDLCGTENGGLNGVAFISDTLLSAVTGTSAATNLISQTWWETQIEAGLIHIIPGTRGTFDGGTAETIPAFRTDETERMKGKTFVVVMNDRNHAGNIDFYKELQNNAQGFILAWNSGNELRVATKPIQNIDAKDPVEEDFNTALRWEATITWKQSKPDIVVPSYDLTEYQVITDLFSKCIDSVTA